MIALAVFVGFFPSVCSQMFLKITCLIGRKVTLGAVVGLFPIVCHYMSLQIAFTQVKQYIVTLVAFV